MSFDRHEILVKHYEEDIREWKWEVVMERFERNSRDPDCFDIDCGQKYVYQYIGGVLNMVPSGKIYAFWTSNQTRSDETKDTAWWEALANVCEEKGCWVGCPDGCDGGDVFLGKHFDYVEETEDEEVLI